MADIEPSAVGDADLQTTTFSDTTTQSLDDQAAQLQSANASDPAVAAQVRQYTAQYIAESGGPGNLGVSSDDEEALVQQVVESLGDTGKSFEQDIHDQAEGILRGQGGNLPDPTQRNVDIQADPVMFNGQYVYQADDLSIDGAGIQFILRRTYKSQAIYYGPLGANWDHQYNQWLQK